MAVDSQITTTDVVICGCGPTGAMLSVLLGQRGVPNIVLERDKLVNIDPRGIALDEEGIRYLQACGIYDKIFTEIGQCMGKFNFIGGRKKVLAVDPFMIMNYNTTEGGTGHPGFICHKQPSIETHLRERMSAASSCDLQLGSTVTGISEDDDWVYTTCTDSEGKQRRLRSRFLIGADGKTGFTRKKYLEPKGITMYRVSQTDYDETWIALNWKINLPTPKSHPDFPLWKKGYTPQQVYDAFFPTDFRFLCNPERAAVCGRFGLPSDRLWRFEFVILPGEDGNEMAGTDKIREVVFPYITHAASIYGLGDDVREIQYPSDCIQVIRCRPFNFSARNCNRWAEGRVVLCGDAAHVFPPFGGQGIASGFRDAISLAWRLVLATKQQQNKSSHSRIDTAHSYAHEKLFEGWYTERKQQLDKSLASTIENGTYVTQTNPFKIFARDWHLWAVQLIPSWKHWLEQGNRRDGMARYRWQEGTGMAFLPRLGGGGSFAQVYVADARFSSGDPLSTVRFSDDVIFSSDKQGLFQLVVFLREVDRDSPMAIRKAITGLDQASGDLLRSSEANFFLNSTTTTTVPGDIKLENVYRLATGQEFARTSLCDGRPEPQFYDPYRMAAEVGGKKFAIVRPDRFVFAACDSVGELLEAARALGTLATGSL